MTAQPVAEYHCGAPPTANVGVLSLHPGTELEQQSIKACNWVTAS